MYKLIEKDNPLAVHGIFDTRERAERHLLVNVPEYCSRGLYADKTLTPDSFKIIKEED